MAKRGRKPKNSPISEDQPVPPLKEYFGELQEKAIVEYLSSTDQRIKDFIYKKFLKFAFEKMTESIINRYKLYSKTMSYTDLFNDTVSFVISKIDKFKPEKNKKAYSYFGTVIKHRLQGIKIEENKSRNRVILYEDIYRVVNEDNLIEVEYVEDNLMLNFFNIISEEIKILVKDESLLKENEYKVGIAILEILENHDRIFQSGSIKYNKNFILECIRNLTMLQTREITKALKFYKVIYIKKKKKYVKDIEESDE